MTIDHVRALDVVLSDGSRARLEPVDGAERKRRATAETLEGRIYQALPDLIIANEEIIRAGMPAFWRRACGYRLDPLGGFGGDKSFLLGQFVGGAGGPLGGGNRAPVDPVAQAAP